MGTFRSNATAYHHSVTSGGFDGYGQAIPGSATDFVAVPVAVISFLDKSLPSPIRSEASATHGRVEQDVAIVELLFPPDHVIAVDDQVKLFNTGLQVISVWPRSNAYGRVQHQKVTLCRQELFHG